MYLDLAIVVLFLFASLLIGVFSSRGVNSFSRFSVGHRAFSSTIIFFTLSASFIGGGYTLGNSAKVFSHGMIYAFALLGFSLKEVLVAMFIAPRMTAYRDCLSIGDMVAKRYGKLAKIFSGCLGVSVCTGILGAQVGAMGAMFNLFLNISQFRGIVIGFGILILYSSLGGMRAVVYTDVLQFLILAIGIPLTLLLGIGHVGGVASLIKQVPHDYLFFLSDKQTGFFFSALFITFIFGETLVPPYVQRLFMAKNTRATQRGILISGLFSIPFFLIAGSIGLVAYVIDQYLDPNLAFPFVINRVLPIGLRGFVIASVLAIIMSSSAGFLNAASVSFVNDIVKPIAGHRIKESGLLFLARSINGLVGVGAICFALSIQNVLDILLYAYNFWSPIMLVPLVALICDFNVTKQDFFLGAVGGIVAMLLWSIVFNTPFHINALVIGVLGNLVFFTLSSLIFSYGKQR